MYAYVFLLYGGAIAGLVILLLYRRTISFTAAEKELPKGKRALAAWWNPGMVLFTVSCFVLILTAVFAG